MGTEAWTGDETLLELDVFAINPKRLDRFRDRHSVACSKDGSTPSTVQTRIALTRLSLWLR